MSVALEKLRERVDGRRVAVIGIGVSNTPVIRQLASLGAKVTARDRSLHPADDAVLDQFRAQGVELRLGDGYLDELDEDMVLRTPGLRFDHPALEAARARGAEVTSEMELFFELCPCPIFGVTGSDGKTTTTTLICEMLARQGFTCHKGGNIGTPLLPVLDDIMPSDMAVVELSSFQLQDMRRSPDVAVITNLSPNHLDYHKDFEEYIQAKANIFRWQTPNDRLVYNAGNAATASLTADAPSHRVAFGWNRCGDGVYCRGDRIVYADESGEREVLSVDEIRLPGRHNVENYMAAVAAVMDYVDPEQIRAVAREFGGVEHRIEWVRDLDGVAYYNDSIASSPSRAQAGLCSFSEPIVLIAGGYDKHLDYSEFGDLVAQRVKALILLGATSEKIRRAVLASRHYSPALSITEVSSMEEAVKAAREQAARGDVVLLSPASASFDLYRNFMERGRHFKDLVNAL